MSFRAVARSGVLLAAAVISCGGEPDDLATYIEQVKARPGTLAEALPQIQPEEEFAYEAAGRPSPFAPVAPVAPVAPAAAKARQAESSSGPVLDREREFLEHYSLDALRMVGSLRQESGLYGLMQTPDGLIHRLATGDYLGRSHGRVIRISEQEVQLMELVADGSGGYLQRPAAISLAD